MSETPLVSSIGFTTRGLRPHEQYDAWRGWFNGTFDGSSRAPAKDGYLATIKALTVEGLGLVRISVPASRTMRTRIVVRRNPIDHWIIMVGKRATTRVTTGDAKFDAPARVPFVLSMADELVSEHGPDELTQLFLGRDRFREFAPVLDAARGKIVTGPLTTMLAEYLMLLDRHIGGIEATSAPPLLSDASGAMVAACLSAPPDAIAAAKSSLDFGRLEKVRRAVRQELRSQLLGPDLLCRLVGMSRSGIYRLMESQGGVARYIRRQRLLESYRELSDPIGDKPIAAIAEELCFSDASDFNRAFRREFGASPNDVRTAVRAGLIPPAVPKAIAGGKASPFNDYIRAL
jgi:AraC-like DNA-binding protein